MQEEFCKQENLLPSAPEVWCALWLIVQNLLNLLENLRGQYVQNLSSLAIVVRSVQLLQGITHLNLRLSIGVNLSSVEKVDAVVPGSLKTVLHNAALLSTAVCQPSTE